jgi:iron complex transport system permease protein
VLRSMQAFLLGTTGFLGWDSVVLLLVVLAVCVAAAAAGSRALDALVLGDDAARSLGVPVRVVRVVLVSVMALATAAAVAQAGLIAFVGLAAPHIVRQWLRPTHRALLLLSALAGGALLLAADLLARSVIAPRELPVGVITAVIGGGYLLWLMQRRQP